VCPIATSFSAEARRVGSTTDRQIAFIEQRISENIGYRHFSCRNKVKIIYPYVVHLSFFVRQLTGTIT